MPFDKKEYMKQYYEKNKDKSKEYYKLYCQTDKGKKSRRIGSWKHQGIITDNFDELYDKFINTEYCELCNCQLTIDRYSTSTTRCLDHHHSSGEIRNILCKRCNSNRQKIDLKFMYVLQELHRYFINET